MARFDVFHERGGGNYLLDCQADLLSDLSTRLIVPLVPAASAPRTARRLNPVLIVAGEPHVMLTQFASAMRRSDLGPIADNLSGSADAIVTALDLLITGV